MRLFIFNDSRRLGTTRQDWSWSSVEIFNFDRNGQRYCHTVTMKDPFSRPTWGLILGTWRWRVSLHENNHGCISMVFIFDSNTFACWGHSSPNWTWLEGQTKETRTFQPAPPVIFAFAQEIVRKSKVDTISAPQSAKILEILYVCNTTYNFEWHIGKLPLLCDMRNVTKPMWIAKWVYTS